MNQISPILRRGPAQYFHYCSACEMMHPLPDSWAFNGNVGKPTFSPSFAQTFVRWTEGVDSRGFGKGEKQHLLCHYVITDGNIDFKSDSWHKRSDTTPMVPIPEGIED